jgi:DNA-binding Xre family transcriptional regulator
MSQYKLAQLSGVSSDTITRVYHNRTRMVSLDVLEQLAKALSCQVGELFEQQAKPRGAAKHT